MKILQIIENIDERYGGPAKSVPNLCKYLQKLGIDISINSVRQYENESNYIIESNRLSWNIYSNTISKFFKFSKELKIGIKKQIEFGNTVLHTQNQWNYIPISAYGISKKYNLPLICSVRGAMLPWALNQHKYVKKLFWFLFQKKIFQNADCIHCTTDIEAEYIRSAGIKTPIAVIPNGIDLTEFEKRAESKNAKDIFKLDVSKKYLLFMGRIHKSKGLDILIKAWKDINKIYPKWNIIYGGPIEDEDYYSELLKYISVNGLEESVKYLGILKGEQRVLAYNAAEVFVSPTWSENFGIAIAEAMASGIPVITTKGAPWEILEKQQCGWWIDLSLEEFEKILEVAINTDEAELKVKGRICKKIIFENYSWNIQALKMIQVYKWMLGKASKPDFIDEGII